MPDIVNFKMVDVDGDGKITADEFKAACGKGLVKNTNSKIMYRWR
jgi:Ca2+-binding EF-hand superfamily protein